MLTWETKLDSRPPANDLARKTAEIANRDVGVREQPPGSNDGPRIREYLATCGLGPGHPYCSCAVCTWVREAGTELQVVIRMAISASALHLLANNGALAFEPETITDQDIPCVFVIDHGGGKGHTGLIVGRSGDGTGLVQTIEANTNPAGSREGDGVYVRTRHMSEMAGCIRIA